MVASDRVEFRPGPLEVGRVRDIARLHEWFDVRKEVVSNDKAVEEYHLAYCYICETHQKFQVQTGPGPVNWRETLRCPGCDLINRWRGGIHVFETVCQPASDARIYLTEAVTPLYRRLRARHPGTVGSEFSPSAPPGFHVTWGERTVEVQDVTRLTFSGGRFDAVLSFDVLEHVPDYPRALAEFHRVLAPGGWLLLSVPFTFAKKTEIRAVIEADGAVRHLLPAQYHGDPLSDRGVLCYQVFGTDLLDDLRGAGFDDAFVACYSSLGWGYPDRNMLFAARRGDG